MGVQNVVKATVAAWTGSSSSKSRSQADHSADAGPAEDGRRPLLTLSSLQSFGPVPPIQSYGATAGGSSSRRGSLEAQRRGSLLGRVPEEGIAAEDDIDGEISEDVEWDLEERGYYGGSYKRAVALYAFVPGTSLIAFFLLVLLPVLVWPSKYSSPSDYPRYFPSPLPELLVSGCLWSFSHLIRLPLYNFTTYLVPWPITGTLFFHVIYVFTNQLLRLSAFPILRVRGEMVYPLPTYQDPAFHRVWWVSLGWAAVEAAVGIAQGYEQISLYENVMVPEDEVRALLRSWKNRSPDSVVHNDLMESPEDTTQANSRPWEERDGVTVNGETERPRARRTKSARLEDAIRTVIDKDVEQLVHLKEREELQELYGIPAIRIPVFVSCLLRIDSFVLSLGLTLTLGASYLRSPLSFPSGPLPPIYSYGPFFVTFPVVVVIYLFLALIHTPPVLPRIGVHSTAYIGLLVGLGSVFGGLGLWGALS